MLVFIDESGDSGLQIARGSSPFFTVALVVFEDREEALACDQRISLLKRELGWATDQEFHFKRNSHRVRQAFFEAVAPIHTDISFPIARCMFRFGQNKKKAPDPIPCGNAAINATVRIESNSNVTMPFFT